MKRSTLAVLFASLVSGAFIDVVDGSSSSQESRSDCAVSSDGGQLDCGSLGFKDTESWNAGGMKSIRQDDNVYEQFRQESFPNYQIRFNEPKLCDPSVKQYSGYFDFDQDKHIFFWFFESRSKPSTAPLMLSLNGGRSCSSSPGALSKLGPCNAVDKGHNTTLNKYSWNTHANVLFLDYVTNVGYSWDEDRNNYVPSSKDVWSFLQLFLNRFPEYSNTLHLSGKSYGGAFLLQMARRIQRGNNAIHARGTQRLAPTLEVRRLHLASVSIGNVFSNPFTQFASVPESACDWPDPVFNTNAPQCVSLRAKIQTCERLSKGCGDSGTCSTRAPAVDCCWSEVFGPFQDLGLIPYDVDQKCIKGEGGDACYQPLGWAEIFLNNEEVKSQLGVPRWRDFKSCDQRVHQLSVMPSDQPRDNSALLAQRVLNDVRMLIEDGARLLIYAVNPEFMRNSINALQWLEGLETSFQTDFAAAEKIPFVSLLSRSNNPVGFVKTAGRTSRSTAGNVTYVQIYEAEHDQSEIAWDMFMRWMMDVPLTSRIGNV